MFLKTPFLYMTNRFSLISDYIHYLQQQTLLNTWPRRGTKQCMKEALIICIPAGWNTDISDTPSHIWIGRK